MTFAHVGGIPIEETLVSVGPALVLAFGVAWANLRARIATGARSRRARAPDGARPGPPASGTPAR